MDNYSRVVTPKQSTINMYIDIYSFLSPEEASFTILTCSQLLYPGCFHPISPWNFLMTVVQVQHFLSFNAISADYVLLRL